MSIRKTLPARRACVTTKIRVGNRQRTIYLTTDTATPPRELFIRVAGQDCTDETIALFDCLARLVSLALQYGCPIEQVGTMLQGVQVQPCGIVQGHDHIRFCSSLPDMIAQHLLSLNPATRSSESR